MLWLVAASVVRAQQLDRSVAGFSDAVDQTRAREPEVAPKTETQSEYFGVVRIAIAEYDAGRFAEARALFLRAHELWPSARTWRTLGMTAFELSLYPKAQSELQRALDDPRRALEDTQRGQVRALLEQTRAFVGRYHVQVSPHDGVLRLDGAPVTLGEGNTLLLGVGRHELRAEAPGFTELRVEVVVQGREDETLELKLDLAARSADLPAAAPASVASAAALLTPGPLAAPDDRKRRRDVAQWLVIGSAAALLTVGISLLAAGARTYSSASAPEDESLSYAEWEDKRDLYRRLVISGGALTGAGAVALASGVWWKLSTRSLHAELSTNGRTLFLRGSF